MQNQCKLYIVQCKMYTVRCTVYNVQFLNLNLIHNLKTSRIYEIKELLQTKSANKTFFANNCRNVTVFEKRMTMYILLHF